MGQTLQKTSLRPDISAKLPRQPQSAPGQSLFGVSLVVKATVGYIGECPNTP